MGQMQVVYVVRQWATLIGWRRLPICRGAQVAVLRKLCTVAPVIFKWLLDFSKIYVRPVLLTGRKVAAQFMWRQ
jgi:hypothetical protein